MALFFAGIGANVNEFFFFSPAQFVLRGEKFEAFGGAGLYGISEGRSSDWNLKMLIAILKVKSDILLIRKCQRS
jgi:hypothetical protein